MTLTIIVLEPSTTSCDMWLCDWNCDITLNPNPDKSKEERK